MSKTNLTGQSLAKLAAFLQRPRPAKTFPGVGYALRMSMERISNRGPSPAEVQAFVKHLRDTQHIPVKVESEVVTSAS